MDVIDDVLEYIASLGDVASDQALLEGPSVIPDNKVIIVTTIHDVLAILPEKTTYLLSGDSFCLYI